MLVLSTFSSADAAVLARVDQDPEHRRRFEFPTDFVPSIEHSEAVIARWAEEYRVGNSFSFAVRDVGSGELVGGCELKPSSDQAANLSYWTHPDHRGRGVATEAVRLASTLAFEQLGFRSLEIATDPDNGASQRVALRNGFAEQGTRGQRLIFVLTEGNWRHGSSG
jgi:RimJ/RimL family protein N-acetyltransferase